MFPYPGRSLPATSLTVAVVQDAESTPHWPAVARSRACCTGLRVDKTLCAFFACRACLMMMHSCLHGAVMKSDNCRGSGRVTGSGAGSCFLGSNLPGTSTIRAPLMSEVVVSVSSSESGSLSIAVLFIASLIPSRVGQELSPWDSPSNDSNATFQHGIRRS